MPRSPYPLLLGAALSLVLAAGCADDTDPVALPALEPELARVASGTHGSDLRVMTRNMYLGGNVDLVLGADLSNPMEVVRASATVWGQVQATRFPERAMALVDEIEKGQPHVVGIQEIPSFVILDPQFKPTGIQDHLEILMAEIRARGLPYEVASVQENITATMPVAIDPTTYQVTQYVRFTDRDALLVRGDLPVLKVDQGNYEARMLPGPGIEILRGWNRITTEWNGVPWHIVNTHLEVQRFAPVQVAQTQQLLEEVLDGLDDGITVLMGDLNSDAEGGPGDPSWTPTYEMLLGEGFQDAWELARPGMPFTGFTCCQNELLRNPTSELGQRIDLILLRPGPGQPGQQRIPGRVKMEIVGDSEGDRTFPSLLWPSDHAGLLAALRIPEGPFRK